MRGPFELVVHFPRRHQDSELAQARLERHLGAQDVVELPDRPADSRTVQPDAGRP